MPHRSRTTVLVAVGICVMLVLALAGQAVTDAGATEVTPTGHAIGRAGFAYLTGVRVFAASVLWNRLDTQLHDYYEGIPLDEQSFIMPSITMITALDPQLVDAYYVVGYVLASRGDTETAFAVAGEGVRNNPESGLLHMSYSQVLYLFGDEDDRQRALSEADYAMDRATWRDAVEQHDGFGVLAYIYKGLGDMERYEQIQQEIARLDIEVGDAIPAGEHDHDGDGIPDH